MHCQLAGFKDCREMAVCCDSHCGCSGGGDCHSDACKIIESGNYFLKKVLVSAPTATYAWIGALETPETLANRRPPAPVATLSAASGAPPGWNRIWQFVFRAAPSPRAPSALCA